MRTVFLGCTKFSERILQSLLKCSQVDLVGIFSIPKEFKISYSEKPVINSNYSDLKPYAESLGIPYFLIDSVKGSRLTDFEREIAQMNLDVILVMGWYYMVPEKIRKLAKYGAWGVHASLLPKYAGGAPLVWAMIEGEKTSGVSLFMLSNGVDDGDIIHQMEFPIEDDDTIKEVYEKATQASETIINLVFGDKNYSVQPKPQDKAKIQIYPQRSPADGEINWDWDASKINRFIRAQTRPYPGAWTTIGNKKITIWEGNVNNSEDGL